MPQQKRSNHYDWFKGSTEGKEKKTPKETAKTVWKFTKIIIYLLLFVFSLTGCIQSLVIKTTNYVGTGVEFFGNEGEVAPHVSTINIKYTPKTTDTEDIYTMGSESTNYWLNKNSMDKEIGQSYVQGASLADVHKTIAGQNEKGNLKLEDAYKGGNEALRINQGGADSLLGITNTNNGPLTISSLSTKTAFKPFDKTTDEDLLKGFMMYSVDESGHSKYEPYAGKIHSFRDDAEFVKKYSTSFSHRMGDSSSIAIGTIFADLDASVKALDSSDKINANIQDEWAHVVSVNEAREEYSLAVLKELISDAKFTSWLKTSLLIGAQTIDSVVKDPEQADLFKRIQAQSADLQFITQTVGLIPNTDAAKDLDIRFQTGTIPFYSGDSDWRPIVTWGEAWGLGPFYGIFVYPVAYISANMIDAFPAGMEGWETLISIFVIVFSIRMLSFVLTFKSTLQQTRMQELTAKKAIIDAKYAPYKGNKQMENRQKQEVSAMYKKEGISPLGSMTSIFISMPFFLAIWRTIGALPHIKSAVWLGINFSATSWSELLKHGEFQYLPLMILAAGFAAFQQILPRLLTKRRDKNRINVQQKAAMKKSNKTQNIMMLVFVFMSIIFSAGLQVYWIAGGIWMTIQSFITHHLIIRHSKNKKRNKVKV